ncbi:DUF1501 domain-containing protein [Rubripirellula reticaptiva]|uniref:Sulfatase n=1 Tax=Rubripirellula reticaptiva TaxID=2528013 RepID=A0A5C6EQM8_9BACT|nr:DUF1501 domain-containing protein [Rubripirellula reticaptiva]TWU51228.1 hypothetical protein Poly59_28200 [Rubripirellula reticaptiva]
MNHPLSRRQYLLRSGLGFGALALDGIVAAEEPSKPDGRPPFQPKAKRVIWLFMRGGVSHMESFDPKPALNQFAGKSISETPHADVLAPKHFKDLRVVVVDDANGKSRNTIYPLQVGFKKHGQSGMEISDWFPRIGSCADDIALIRSMWTTDNNHGAQVQFHSGRHMLDPRAPTIGAWINYGLGSLSDNLPQFINIGPRFFDKRDGHYLGPAYDAVNLKVDPANPLDYASPYGGMNAAEQLGNLNFTNGLNRLAAEQFPGDPALEARIQSYELAFRMQTAVPDVLDFDSESEETRKLYGLDQAETKTFGQQLLAARRFSERGVRFIQIMHGDGAAGAWDHHSGLKQGHAKLSKQVDLPTAGLLKDLKQRGLLEDTIVVFATEFGRTPGSQGADGRDHHPFGFSVWMAGGGLKGGVVHGSTDELGFHAVENPHYVTDVHATINHLLGIDPRRLEVPGYKRLDQDYGNIIKEIIA